MNPWILTIIWTILPVSELRGGIAYAILNGIHPLSAFLVCVLFNILIIPIIFFFLDHINRFLLKIKLWDRFFTGYLTKKTEKIKRKYEVLSFFVLFLFVAIPAPGTGAYTGVLLSWFFKLNRKKSFFVIALGVIAAGIITTILILLGKSLFDLLQVI
jgi:uncharacterized membrane protein